LTDEVTALVASEGRPIERQLLGDRAVDPVAEILADLQAKELGSELGDAGVVDPSLQLGVRIHLRGRSDGCGAVAVRRRKGCCSSFPLPGETIVESHCWLNSSTG
jgi:hypothetical protein